jgi:hypothetical protein
VTYYTVFVIDLALRRVQIAGNYGIGWNVGSDPLRRQVYHSGNKPGFSAIIRHYLDES